MGNEPLATLYAEHGKKVSDKWSRYLTEYERLFQDYQTMPVRLLEIGIQNGGSLEIWSKYFPHAQKLVGCDINPDCARLTYEDPRIAVVVGDANSDAAQAEILGYAPALDLIIDDGSHRSSDIIKSFARYFPYLVDGGIYVAEDLHCSYWKEYEGGLFDPFSSMTFFKRLADIVNHENWGIEKACSDILSGFLTKYGFQIDEEALQHIHSVEFFSSVCVIRKARPERNRLGARIIAGSTGAVVPGHVLRSSLDKVPDQTGNEWTARSLPPDEELLLRIKELADRDGQIVGLNATLSEREGQIARLKQVELHHDAMLASTSWRVTKPLRIVGLQLKRAGHVWRLLPKILRMRGGLRGTLIAAFRVMCREGWTGVRWRIAYAATGKAPLLRSPALSTDSATSPNYDEWVRRHDSITTYDRELIAADIGRMTIRPLISIVMPTYNSDEIWLRRAVQSVLDQAYPNWELCIADDASSKAYMRPLLTELQELDSRIKVVFRSENGNIAAALNSAIDIAGGEFLAFLDHDDEISETALYYVAHEINGCPDADFIYSDQDKIDVDGARSDPYFKPDFNPDLLRSQNYVDHLAVFRTSLVRELGKLRSEFDGSQDYDLVLRTIEATTPERIRHIPRVLYHWRAVPGSIALDVDAKPAAAERSREALREHLRRCHVPAQVTSDYPKYSVHRVVYPLPDQPPLVSVIIPTKDRLDLLRDCVGDVLNNTEYPDLEVIIVDNQSEEEATLLYLREIANHPKVRVLSYAEKFNYSAINNLAARHARGSVLALLNNDLRVINKGWLREMVSHAIRPEIGAVGARLYYADDTVQHAGVFLGYRGLAGHLFRYSARDSMEHWARGSLTQNLSAVTAACMVLRKDVFDAVNGFCEGEFTVTFNDVDLCLRIQERGYRNLYAPHAELYHLESATRKDLAYQEEEDHFKRKWAKLIANDPAYNPNLTLLSEDLALASPPRVRPPWREMPQIRDWDQGRPLVSLITRTHGNRDEFLGEAIDSVCGQTYRPIELIVVEDGPGDAGKVIDGVRPWPGVTIHHVPMEKIGRCRAGNVGLETARGKYVGFLDDDDLLLPHHVETLATFLENRPHIAAAYGNALEVPTNTISLRPLVYAEGKARLFQGHPFSLQALWKYNNITIQSVMFRRSLFERFGGLEEQLECLEDWDLWLRYSAEVDFAYVESVTSLFRMPDNKKALKARRKLHLHHLPIVRERQETLYRRYRGTPFESRLYPAFLEASRGVRPQFVAEAEA